MEILDSYIYTKKRFFGYMLNDYSIVEDTFYCAPKIEQYKALVRFLGLPVSFPHYWNLDVICNYVQNNLYIYESLLIDYDFDIPDPLNEMKFMNYNQMIEYMPEIFESIIIQSFGICLVERLTNNISQSFKDCLIRLNKIITPAISDEQFWINAFKEFINHETIPF